MSENKHKRRIETWLLLFIIAIIIMLAVAIQLHWFRLRFSIAGELSHHWIGWLGAGFIVIFLPIFSILKRLYPHRLNTLTRIHIFGNLLAFMAITTHFTHQLTRPIQAFPTLGTGLALVVALVISVLTGLVLRSQFTRKRYKSWRWIHTSMVLGFYIIILFHILHGTGVINQ
jgi:hypothetical protein